MQLWECLRTGIGRCGCFRDSGAPLTPHRARGRKHSAFIGSASLAWVGSLIQAVVGALSGVSRLPSPQGKLTVRGKAAPL